jgi:hypothetical protein
MRRHFVVKVTHGDKPLPGVSVWIASNIEGKGNRLSSSITAADGTANIADLSPGEYWLTAELLGIIAGSECLHVGLQATKKAKSILSYNWGDLAPAVSQIEGKLIDSQPAQSGTPLWNQLHPVEVPIGKARLTLQDPFTGQIKSTLSDAEGHFSFRGVPEGTYVLHIEAGTASGARDYESTDVLFRSSGTAKQRSLLLKRREGFPGSCGGTSLELQNAPNS